MSKSQQKFGGDWTEEKLQRLHKYLRAYTRIMVKKRFRFAYIDAFAGTGYRTLRATPRKSDDLLFPELAQEQAQSFISGSAPIALGVTPRFSKYIFIEKNAKRFAELEKIKTKYPNLAADINLHKGDANDILLKLCRMNWEDHRAVLFLDPFGMQVRWSTIEAIAATRAIDVWILFPLGSAVNRLLKKNAEIPPRWKRRLDDFFGTTTWYDAFYKEEVRADLFGEERTRKKVANFESIGDYFVERLRKVFPAVADNPLRLENSRGMPLFLLCFAAANARGGETAVKIAQSILRP